MVWHNTFPPQRRQKWQKVCCARAGAKGVKVFGSANSVGLPFIQKNVFRSTTLKIHFRIPVLVSLNFQYYTRKIPEKNLYLLILVFKHDAIGLTLKPASTPWCLTPKQTWRDSLPIDMLLSMSVSVVLLS
jgi:hypothetical protein